MRSAARLLVPLVLAAAMFGPAASRAQVPDVTPCLSPFHIGYRWHMVPLHPQGGDSLALVFSSCAPCVQLIGYSKPPIGPLRIQAQLQQVCPLSLVCIEDSLVVPLGILAAGNYRLLVQVDGVVMQGDSSLCSITQLDTLAFTVGSPPPPPPPGDSLGLPYVTTIAIGSPGPCNTCPPVVCPGQAYPVTVAGDFHTNCLALLGMKVVPSIDVTPFPHPPTLLITVVANDCLGAPCNEESNPWTATVLVPPTGLGPGLWGLPLRMEVVSICDTTHVDTSYATQRPFAVLDSCPPPPPGSPCLMVDWDHSTRSDGPCDTFVGPGQPGHAVMTIMTPVPLAGLQGRLRLFPLGLRVEHLEPLGPAAGMHLTWAPTADGVTFVMFAEQGAPIGPTPGPGSPPVPVLGVTVVPDSGLAPPALTYLTAQSVLGADSLAGAVGECPVMTLVLRAATICSAASCDANRDGRLDVRDLVLMVHCVLGTGPCPDTTQARFDCNQDGQVNVEDVLCCAPRVLRGDNPDTTGARPEPDVNVALGGADWDGGQVAVPLSVSGSDKVGAVRVALRFPSDRYDVAGVDAGPFASSWLVVHEVVDGRLVVGLISMAGAATAAQDGPGSDLRVVVRLAPRAGQPAGGDVSIGEAQLVGPDGAPLVVQVGDQPLPLPAPGQLALSPPHPNPFRTDVRFTLDLVKGANVEVSIHDLSGRTIATLQRGALAAGPHELIWTGTRSDGTRAPHGVYFVQARVAGERLTRKVVFLRGQ